MENNIDISILMATRNPNPRYICECLQSIDQQTYRNFELVIVDDASDKVEVSDFLEGYDFPIQILRNEDQLGLAKSLNKGLKLARGKYIARIDDDDIMLPTRLEKQYNYAQTHNGLIFSEVCLIDDEGQPIASNGAGMKDTKRYLKRSGNCLTHSSLFVNRSILEKADGYDERFVYAQDYALYMKLIDTCDFFVLDETLVKYRVPANRSPRMKKILSLLSCYGASVNYFASHKSMKNMFYFFRRSLSLLKSMYVYMRG